MIVSGVTMWWRRRPVGRIGAPALQNGVQLPFAFIVIIVLVGVLLPLAGISLVMVLLLDSLVLKRLPTLHSALQ